MNAHTKPGKEFHSLQECFTEIIINFLMLITSNTRLKQHGKHKTNCLLCWSHADRIRI